MAILENFKIGKSGIDCSYLVLVCYYDLF